ncbi:hypothetical protein LY78DRAFT_417012 [Colletotrichum sublineola]|nr:hypothetical protein LY78DRAFT_417012 [Colletotrichum sublineola]
MAVWCDISLQNIGCPTRRPGAWGCMSASVLDFELERGVCVCVCVCVWRCVLKPISAPISNCLRPNARVIVFPCFKWGLPIAEMRPAFALQMRPAPHFVAYLLPILQYALSD